MASLFAESAQAPGVLFFSTGSEDGVRDNTMRKDTYASLTSVPNSLASSWAERQSCKPDAARNPDGCISTRNVTAPFLQSPETNEMRLSLYKGDTIPLTRVQNFLMMRTLPSE